MDGPGQDLSHAEIGAEISNAVVRATREYTGRGPTRARTVYEGDLISCVLQDTLTQGERTLAAHGRAGLVLSTRREYQAVMRTRLVGDIERISGRKVIAFMSDNHIEPDYAVESFVLAPESTVIPLRPPAA
jgi:uncharacterized protein YbcI